MPRSLTHVRTFAHHHDELPAFHAGYLVFSFLVASLFSMGAFAMLVLIHMGLDVVKYREYHHLPWKEVLEGVIRESLLDITLVFVGLVFAVYLHHSLIGVAGLSGILRAEVTITRALGTILPKLKILEDFLKVVVHIHHYMQSIHPMMRRGLSSMEFFSVFCLITCALLLLIAPSLLATDIATVTRILIEEMTPHLL